MRSLTVTGLVAAVAVLPLRAQRGHQFEFGPFGSYTRYDRAFNLSDQAGGGGRLGYFFSDVVGVELDAGYQSPSPRTGTSPVPAQLSFGSASLVLNVAAGAHHLLYLLGGYSRLDFEKQSPYRFTDNGVHGAVGDRVFLGERAALRLEARGIYAPSTKAPFGSSWAGHVIATVGLSLFTGAGRLVDSDGDGIPDKNDACPATPLGATVDQRGCPADADADGVYNGLDACPNTPAGTGVDAVGCPVAKDSDGDGVDDGRDKCPGTAPGTRVDAFGCPILFTPERRPVVLRGVTFETGKSALRPESYAVLDVVAQSLLDNPEIRVEVAGYTDNTGSATMNVRLSQARADAVRAYLASRGLSPARMVSRGYGPDSPLATNTTAAGRAQNRRVELHQLP